jgi:putative resolvase
MKANEVLSTLRITRQTLTRYVKEGVIKVHKNPKGRYQYDEKSVYSFLNRGNERKTVLYSRVSTRKQKSDLHNQVELLKNYCFSKGIRINGIYSDTASGISFANRIEFLKMVDEIIAGNIGSVIISYRDRLSRIGFEIFESLFKKFGTEIIVISDVGGQKLDDDEILEEIESLLQCYSIELYSKRKAKAIKEVISG